MYELKLFINSDLSLRQKRFKSICSGSLPSSSYYFDRLTNQIYEIDSTAIFEWRDNVIRENFIDPSFLSTLSINDFVKNIENRNLVNYFFQQSVNKSLVNNFLKSTLDIILTMTKNNNKLLDYYLQIFNIKTNTKKEKLDEEVVKYYREHFNLSDPFITILSNSINLDENVPTQDNKFNKQRIIENIDKQSFLSNLKSLPTQDDTNNSDKAISSDSSLNNKINEVFVSIDDSNQFNFNKTSNKTGNARIFFNQALKNIPTEHHHQFLKLYPLIEKIELIESYHIESLLHDIYLIDELIASQLKTALISYQLSHLDIEEEVNSLSTKIDNFLTLKSEEFLDVLLEKEINHIESLRTNFRKIIRI